MRKVLLFLLVFGAGFAVLFWFQERDKSERRDRSAEEEAGSQGAPTPSDPGTEGGTRPSGAERMAEGSGDDRPTTRMPVDGDQEVEIRISGYLRHARVRESDGRLIDRLEAQNVVPLEGNLYRLEDVVVDLHDPEKNHKRSRIVAKFATARYDAEIGQIDPNQPILFEDVVMTLLEDWPFAPATLTVPELRGTLESGVFVSEEAVDLLGTGLVAEGEGLQLDGNARRLTLHGNSSATLNLDGSEAEIRATRNLSLWNPLDASGEPHEVFGKDAVVVTADGDSVLEIGGDQPLDLRGDRLRVEGLLLEDTSAQTPPGEPGEDPDTQDLEPDDKGSQFLPRVADVDGHARILLGTDRFRGGRARIEFDEEGNPIRSILEDRPSVDLTLFNITQQEILDRLPEDDEGLAIKASGRGPLVVELGDEQTFSFQGPCTVEIPDLGGRFDVTGRLDGERTDEGGLTQLTAAGGVEGTLDDWSLDAVALDLRTEIDEDGTTGALRIGATGPATLDGPLGLEDDAERTTFIAREEIQIIRHPDRIEVPRARGVDVVVHGEGGFRARANELRHFDSESQTFEAEGSVRWNHAGGIGQGHRLIGLARNHVRLIGDDTEQARYRAPEGTLLGDSIEALPSGITAVGSAKLDSRLPGEPRFHLEGARVRVLRRDVGATPHHEIPEDQRGVPGLEFRRYEVVLEAQDQAFASLVTTDHATLPDSTIEVNGALVRVLGQFDAPEGELPESIDALQILRTNARGEVVLVLRSPLQLEAHGASLELRADGTGELLPEPGERVRAVGRHGERQVDFDFRADRFDLTPEGFSATAPSAVIEGIDLPLGQAMATDGQDLPRVDIDADTLTWDLSAMRLSGNVRLARRGGEDKGQWTLRSAEAMLRSDPEKMQTSSLEEAMESLFLWGGFEAELGEDIIAKGDTMLADRKDSRVILRGSDTTLASLATPAMIGESEWLEWDAKTGLMSCDAGTIRSIGTQEEGVDPWSMSFVSMEPRTEGDQSLQVVREPTITQGDQVVRAGWAIIWVDSKEWSRLSGSFLGNEDRTDDLVDVPDPTLRQPDEKAGRMPSLLEDLMSNDAREWLNEFYLDGDVEILEAGERRMRADAIYLDLTDGHGWIRNAVVTVPIPSERGNPRLSIRTEWLRHSADGSLRADEATLTTDEYEVPQYVLRTGDLRITPKPAEDGEEPYWEVRIRDNDLVFQNFPDLPLPTIRFPMEEDFGVDPNQVSILGLRPGIFGSSAVLGFFIRLEFDDGLDEIAKGLHRALGGSSKRPKGQNILSASYYDRRGPSLGYETTMEDPGLYWLHQNVDAILDTGMDRGLVRVPESDRNDLRLWYRLRGRYELAPKTWIDTVITYQNDPGVQAEFFRREYVEFEERNTFLHGRHADGDRYGWTTLDLDLDNFRTDVDRLPELGWFDGLSEVGKFLGKPILYEAKSSAGFYRRREGDAQYFEAPFADGLGEREVLRLDTRHRFESPLPFAGGGLIATPWVQGRLTAWDEAADPLQSSPVRTNLAAGVELSSLAWRAFDNGMRHELIPSIGVRSNIQTRDRGIQTIAIDRTEESLFGDFLDVGLRSNLKGKDRRYGMDLELRTSFGRDLRAPARDGWQPLRVHGDWRFDVGSVPFAVVHDARYDLRDDETDYSRTFVGFQPIEELVLDIGYHSGRSPLNGSRLYRAASVGARYRIDSKWELEGRQTISTQANERLGASGLIRRFGRNFVFEVEMATILGQGGNSLQFSLIPLLGFRDRRFGILERWRTEGDL